MQKEIEINTPFITLGQLLKEEGIIGTGGQAKWYLREHTVLVNEEPDDRRGRKLYANDVIEVPDEGSFKITTKSGK
ncbi:S4 domain-containing protein YaaA [Pediococcus acidilactici]|jgi:S4 domain protein YaaA|nr:MULTISPECIES: S4 domain-containing protein YaaA [Lactobacillaceae]GAC46049.1 S4 domain protein YaaA [Pediococcus acidilactici NGRI 0510Q]AOW74757.1 RNA-binding protein [Pediococcus acidilactici]APR27488.1 RNA-binding protein [Pediococcus acidilactici]AZP89818.1 S4 domain-containing protein YaaA [Pediococcus acidilactici]EFA27259.1 S4 domain protein YaaA [Pediococcus acidilactici 7_4]